MDNNKISQSELKKWALFLLVVMLFTSLYLDHPPAPQKPVMEISYSSFKSLIEDGSVDEVLLRGNAVEGKLFQPQPLGLQGEEYSRFTTRIPDFGDEGLLEALENKQVMVRVREPEVTGTWRTAIIGLLPWIIIFGFYIWFIRRASRDLAGGLGGRGDLKKFLEPPSEQAKTPSVTFADVAGQENAKREVTELVEFLHDPGRFTRLGAEVPRGILLMGAPGTGKTLLARALAGEANVPFFTISASEFIEVFVGVGAARVRRLFQSAKKSAPSIIFIDELDSIGRTRGTGLGGGHDEREQTLNQILAEMDGFSEHEAVIILAATNRPDVLDPALLRPGRFDRHVILDLPDRKDREAILKVHTRKMPLDDDVDLDRIAAGTPGFSGADLKNIANESAMLAGRERLEKVAMKHFDSSRDKLLLGSERTLSIQPEERHRLAVHEAGHTVVAYFLPLADPLYKVTILPRGKTLGGTHQIPEKERHTLPEDYLRDRLALMLGGRAAEKALIGTVSSGADNDIHQATTLARAMVSRWGMSDKVGPVDLRESEEHPFLGRDMAQPRRFSEKSASAVDEAVRELILTAEKRAGDVLNAHLQEMNKLIQMLEEEETLHRGQIETCLGSPGNSVTA